MDHAAFIEGVYWWVYRQSDGDATEAAIWDWEVGEVTRNVGSGHLPEINQS
jgi:hypothetical protein